MFYFSKNHLHYEFLDDDDDDNDNDKNENDDYNNIKKDSLYYRFSKIKLKKIYENNLTSIINKPQNRFINPSLPHTLGSIVEIILKILSESNLKERDVIINLIKDLENIVSENKIVKQNQSNIIANLIELDTDIQKIKLNIKDNIDDSLLEKRVKLLEDIITNLLD